ncbi:hypothetical protein SAMN05216215_10809, partial [Saccharopolyspora shandongensis]
MAIMFSEFERQLCYWLTGDEPPPVNEDKVRELAVVWRSHAGRLRRLRVDARAAVEGIRSSGFAGASERAFAARMAPFVDGPSNYLDAAADHFDAMADALDQIAMEVEFLKLVVLIQLALLAVEFEFFVQWFWVPGVQTWFMSQAFMHRVVVEKAVAWIARRMASVPRVPVEILGMLAVSFGQQLGVVWLAQQIQIGEGTREEHDGKHYESAAVIAAVGSVLSFGAMGALPKLKGAIRDWVKRAGGDAGAVDGWFASPWARIGGEGLHEGVTETVAIGILEGKFEVNPAAFTAGGASAVAEIAGEKAGAGLLGLVLEQEGNKHVPGDEDADSGYGSDEDADADDAGSESGSDSSESGGSSGESGYGSGEDADDAGSESGGGSGESSYGSGESGSGSGESGSGSGDGGPGLGSLAGGTSVPPAISARSSGQGDSGGSGGGRDVVLPGAGQYQPGDEHSSASVGEARRISVVEGSGAVSGGGETSGGRGVPGERVGAGGGSDTKSVVDPVSAVASRPGQPGAQVPAMPDAQVPATPGDPGRSEAIREESGGGQQHVLQSRATDDRTPGEGITHSASRNDGFGLGGSAQSEPHSAGSGQALNADEAVTHNRANPSAEPTRQPDGVREPGFESTSERGGESNGERGGESASVAGRDRGDESGGHREFTGESGGSRERGGESASVPGRERGDESASTQGGGRESSESGGGESTSARVPSGVPAAMDTGASVSGGVDVPVVSRAAVDSGTEGGRTGAASTPAQAPAAVAGTGSGSVSGMGQGSGQAPATAPASQVPAAATSGAPGAVTAGAAGGTSAAAVSGSAPVGAGAATPGGTSAGSAGTTAGSGTSGGPGVLAAGSGSSSRGVPGGMPSLRAGTVGPGMPGRVGDGSGSGGVREVTAAAGVGDGADSSRVESSSVVGKVGGGRAPGPGVGSGSGPGSRRELLAMLVAADPDLRVYAGLLGDPGALPGKLRAYAGKPKKDLRLADAGVTSFMWLNTILGGRVDQLALTGKYGPEVLLGLYELLLRQPRRGDRAPRIALLVAELLGVRPDQGSSKSWNPGVWFAGSWSPGDWFGRSWNPRDWFGRWGGKGLPATGSEKTAAEVVEEKTAAENRGEKTAPEVVDEKTRSNDPDDRDGLDSDERALLAEESDAASVVSAVSDGSDRTDTTSLAEAEPDGAGREREIHLEFADPMLGMGGSREPDTMPGTGPGQGAKPHYKPMPGGQSAVVWSLEGLSVAASRFEEAEQRSEARNLDDARARVRATYEDLVDAPGRDPERVFLAALRRDERHDALITIAAHLMNGSPEALRVLPDLQTVDRDSAQVLLRALARNLLQQPREAGHNNPAETTQVSASSVDSEANPDLVESYAVARRELEEARQDRQQEVDEAFVRADAILGPVLREYPSARVLMARQFLRFPNDDGAAAGLRAQLEGQMSRLAHIGAGAGPGPGVVPGPGVQAGGGGASGSSSDVVSGSAGGAQPAPKAKRNLRRDRDKAVRRARMGELRQSLEGLNARQAELAGVPALDAAGRREREALQKSIDSVRAEYNGLEAVDQRLRDQDAEDQRKSRERKAARRRAEALSAGGQVSFAGESAQVAGRSRQSEAEAELSALITNAEAGLKRMRDEGRQVRVRGVDVGVGVDGLISDMRAREVGVVFGGDDGLVNVLAYYMLSHPDDSQGVQELQERLHWLTAAAQLGEWAGIAGRDAVDRLLAAADGILGPLKVSERFRTVLAHWLGEHPGDWHGAQAVRAEMAGYLAGDPGIGMVVSGLTHEAFEEVKAEEARWQAGVRAGNQVEAGGVAVAMRGGVVDDPGLSLIYRASSVKRMLADAGRALRQLAVDRVDRLYAAAEKVLGPLYKSEPFRDVMAHALMTRDDQQLQQLMENPQADQQVRDLRWKLVRYLAGDLDGGAEPGVADGWLSATLTAEGKQSKGKEMYWRRVAIGAALSGLRDEDAINGVLRGEAVEDALRGGSFARDLGPRFKRGHTWAQEVLDPLREQLTLDLNAAVDSLRQILEDVEANTDLRSKYEAKIQQWLNIKRVPVAMIRRRAEEVIADVQGFRNDARGKLWELLADGEYGLAMVEVVDLGRDRVDAALRAVERYVGPMPKQTQKPLRDAVAHRLLTNGISEEADSDRKADAEAFLGRLHRLTVMATAVSAGAGPGGDMLPQSAGGAGSETVEAPQSAFTGAVVGDPAIDDSGSSAQGAAFDLHALAGAFQSVLQQDPRAVPAGSAASGRPPVREQSLAPDLQGEIDRLGRAGWSREDEDAARGIVQGTHDHRKLLGDADLSLDQVVALVAAKYHEVGRNRRDEVVEFSRALADRLGTRGSGLAIHAGAGPEPAGGLPRSADVNTTTGRSDNPDSPERNAELDRMREQLRDLAGLGSGERERRETDQEEPGADRQEDPEDDVRRPEATPKQGSVHSPTPQPDSDRPYSSYEELVADLHRDAADPADSVNTSGLSSLGPNLFNLRQPEPAPDFLRGHDYGEDYSNLSAAQGIAVLESLDLRKSRPTWDAMRPDALQGDVQVMTRKLSNRERIDWAPAGIHLPLPAQLETPKVVHSVWFFGAPLSDAFRQNLEISASQAPTFLFVNLPRVRVEEAIRRQPTDPADPLTAVWDFVRWTQESGVIPVSLAEVSNADTPFDLAEATATEMLKLDGPGWAAASDNVRMSVLKRFGGAYLDSDNHVTDVDRLFSAVNSRAAYAVNMGVDGDDPNNDAWVMPKRHRAAQVWISLQARNYDATQVELFPEALLGADFRQPGGNATRNSVLFRTGPGLFNDFAQVLEYRDKHHLPPISGIERGGALSWGPESATQPQLSSGRQDALFVAKAVVETLARDLLSNRDGDLHLTAVRRTIDAHPQRDLLWNAVVSFIASRPDLAGAVHSVTLEAFYEHGDVRLELPETASRLIEIDDDPFVLLGEGVYPAHLNEPVGGDTTTTPSPIDTATSETPHDAPEESAPSHRSSESPEPGGRSARSDEESLADDSSEASSDSDVSESWPASGDLDGSLSTLESSVADLRRAVGRLGRAGWSREDEDAARGIVQGTHDHRKLLGDADLSLDQVVALVAAKYHEVGRNRRDEVVEFSRALADRLGTRGSGLSIRAGAGPEESGRPGLSPRNTFAAQKEREREREALEARLSALEASLEQLTAQKAQKAKVESRSPDEERDLRVVRLRGALEELQARQAALEALTEWKGGLQANRDALPEDLAAVRSELLAGVRGEWEGLRGRIEAVQAELAEIADDGLRREQVREGESVSGEGQAAALSAGGSAVGSVPGGASAEVVRPAVVVELAGLVGRMEEHLAALPADFRPDVRAQVAAVREVAEWERWTPEELHSLDSKLEEVRQVEEYLAAAALSALISKANAGLERMRRQGLPEETLPINGVMAAVQARMGPLVGDEGIRNVVAHHMLSNPGDVAGTKKFLREFYGLVWGERHGRAVAQLREWRETADPDAVDRLLADADGILGPLKASGRFRDVLAHWLREHPGDLRGAQAVRAELADYLAGDPDIGVAVSGLTPDVFEKAKADEARWHADRAGTQAETGSVAVPVVPRFDPGLDADSQVSSIMQAFADAGRALRQLAVDRVDRLYAAAEKVLGPLYESEPFRDVMAHALMTRDDQQLQQLMENPRDDQQVQELRWKLVCYLAGDLSGGADSKAADDLLSATVDPEPGDNVPNGNQINSRRAAVGKALSGLLRNDAVERMLQTEALEEALREDYSKDKLGDLFNRGATWGSEIRAEAKKKLISDLEAKAYSLRQILADVEASAELWHKYDVEIARWLNLKERARLKTIRSRVAEAAAAVQELRDWRRNYAIRELGGIFATANGVLPQYALDKVDQYFPGMQYDFPGVQDDQLRNAVAHRLLTNGDNREDAQAFLERLRRLSRLAAAVSAGAGPEQGGDMRSAGDPGPETVEDTRSESAEDAESDDAESDFDEEEFENTVRPALWQRLKDLRGTLPFGTLRPLGRPADPKWASWFDAWTGERSETPRGETWYMRGNTRVPVYEVAGGRVLGSADLARIPDGEGSAAVTAFVAATGQDAQPLFADVDGRNVQAYLEWLDRQGVLGHALVVRKRKRTQLSRVFALPFAAEGMPSEEAVDAWYVRGEYAEGEEPSAGGRLEDLRRAFFPSDDDSVLEQDEFYVHVVDPIGGGVAYGVADQGLWLRGRDVEWGGLFAVLDGYGPAELMGLVNPGVRWNQYLAQVLGVDELTARVWRMWSHLPEDWHAGALRRAIIGSVVSKFGGREAVKRLVEDLVPDGPWYQERLHALGEFMMSLAGSRGGRLEGSWVDDGRDTTSADTYAGRLRQVVDWLGGRDRVAELTAKVATLSDDYRESIGLPAEVRGLGQLWHHIASVPGPRLPAFFDGGVSSVDTPTPPGAQPDPDMARRVAVVWAIAESEPGIRWQTPDTGGPAPQPASQPSKRKLDVLRELAHALEGRELHYLEHFFGSIPNIAQAIGVPEDIVSSWHHPNSKSPWYYGFIRPGDRAVLRGVLLDTIVAAVGGPERTVALAARLRTMSVVMADRLAERGQLGSPEAPGHGDLPSARTLPGILLEQKDLWALTLADVVDHVAGTGAASLDFSVKDLVDSVGGPGRAAEVTGLSESTIGEWLGGWRLRFGEEFTGKHKPKLWKAAGGGLLVPELVRYLGPARAIEVTGASEHEVWEWLGGHGLISLEEAGKLRRAVLGAIADGLLNQPARLEPLVWSVEGIREAARRLAWADATKGGEFPPESDRVFELVRLRSVDNGSEGPLRASVHYFVVQVLLGNEDAKAMLERSGIEILDPSPAPDRDAARRLLNQIEGKLHTAGEVLADGVLRRVVGSAASDRFQEATGGRVPHPRLIGDPDAVREFMQKTADSRPGAHFFVLRVPPKGSQSPPQAEYVAGNRVQDFPESGDFFEEDRAHYYLHAIDVNGQRIDPDSKLSREVKAGAAADLDWWAQLGGLRASVADGVGLIGTSGTDGSGASVLPRDVPERTVTDIVTLLGGPEQAEWLDSRLPRVAQLLELPVSVRLERLGDLVQIINGLTSSQLRNLTGRSNPARAYFGGDGRLRSAALEAVPNLLKKQDIKWLGSVAKLYPGKVKADPRLAAEWDDVNKLLAREKTGSRAAIGGVYGEAGLRLVDHILVGEYRSGGDVQKKVPEKLVWLAERLGLDYLRDKQGLLGGAPTTPLGQEAESGTGANSTAESSVSEVVDAQAMQDFWGGAPGTSSDDAESPADSESGRGGSEARAGSQLPEAEQVARRESSSSRGPVATSAAHADTGNYRASEHTDDPIDRFWSETPWRAEVDRATAALQMTIRGLRSSAAQTLRLGDLDITERESALTGPARQRAEELRAELVDRVAHRISQSDPGARLGWPVHDDATNLANDLRNSYQELLAQNAFDTEGDGNLGRFREDSAAALAEARDGLDRVAADLEQRWRDRGRDQLGISPEPEHSPAERAVLDDLALAVGRPYHQLDALTAAAWADGRPESDGAALQNFADDLAARARDDFGSIRDRFGSPPEQAAETVSEPGEHQQDAPAEESREGRPDSESAETNAEDPHYDSDSDSVPDDGFRSDMTPAKARASLQQLAGNEPPNWHRMPASLQQRFRTQAELLLGPLVETDQGQPAARERAEAYAQLRDVIARERASGVFWNQTASLRKNLQAWFNHDGVERVSIDLSFAEANERRETAQAGDGLNRARTEFEHRWSAELGQGDRHLQELTDPGEQRDPLAGRDLSPRDQQQLRQQVEAALASRSDEVETQAREHAEMLGSLVSALASEMDAARQVAEEPELAGPLSGELLRDAEVEPGVAAARLDAIGDRFGSGVVEDLRVRAEGLLTDSADGWSTADIPGPALRVLVDEVASTLLPQDVESSAVREFRATELARNTEHARSLLGERPDPLPDRGPTPREQHELWQRMEAAVASQFDGVEAQAREQAEVLGGSLAALSTAMDAPAQVAENPELADALAGELLESTGIEPDVAAARLDAIGDRFGSGVVEDLRVRAEGLLTDSADGWSTADIPGPALRVLVDEVASTLLPEHVESTAERMSQEFGALNRADGELAGLQRRFQERRGDVIEGAKRTLVQIARDGRAAALAALRQRATILAGEPPEVVPGVGPDAATQQALHRDLVTVLAAQLDHSRIDIEKDFGILDLRERETMLNRELASLRQRPRSAERAQAEQHVTEQLRRVRNDLLRRSRDSVEEHAWRATTGFRQEAEAIRTWTRNGPVPAAHGEGWGADWQDGPSRRWDSIGYNAASDHLQERVKQFRRSWATDVEAGQRALDNRSEEDRASILAEAKRRLGPLAPQDVELTEGRVDGATTWSVGITGKQLNELRDEMALALAPLAAELHDLPETAEPAERERIESGLGGMRTALLQGRNAAELGFEGLLQHQRGDWLDQRFQQWQEPGHGGLPDYEQTAESPQYTESGAPHYETDSPDAAALQQLSDRWRAAFDQARQSLDEHGDAARDWRQQAREMLGVEQRGVLSPDTAQQWSALHDGMVDAVADAGLRHGPEAADAVLARMWTDVVAHGVDRFMEGGPTARTVAWHARELRTLPAQEAQHWRHRALGRVLPPLDASRGELRQSQPAHNVMLDGLANIARENRNVMTPVMERFAARSVVDPDQLMRQAPPEDYGVTRDSAQRALDTLFGNAIRNAHGDEDATTTSLAEADSDTRAEVFDRADSILGPTLREYQLARELMAHKILNSPNDRTAWVQLRAQLQRQMSRLAHISAGAGPEPGAVPRPEDQGSGESAAAAELSALVTNANDGLDAVSDDGAQSSDDGGDAGTLGSSSRVGSDDGFGSPLTSVDSVSGDSAQSSGDDGWGVGTFGSSSQVDSGDQFDPVSGDGAQSSADDVWDVERLGSSSRVESDDRVESWLTGIGSVSGDGDRLSDGSGSDAGTFGRRSSVSEDEVGSW